MIDGNLSRAEATEWVGIRVVPGSEVEYRTAAQPEALVSRATGEAADVPKWSLAGRVASKRDHAGVRVPQLDLERTTVSMHRQARLSASAYA